MHSWQPEDVHSPHQEMRVWSDAKRASPTQSQLQSQLFRDALAYSVYGSSRETPTRLGKEGKGMCSFPVICHSVREIGRRHASEMIVGLTGWRG